MNRPEPLLHVVDAQKVVHTRQTMQQLVLEAEAGSWSDDRGLRK